MGGGGATTTTTSTGHASNNNADDDDDDDDDAKQKRKFGRREMAGETRLAARSNRPLVSEQKIVQNCVLRFRRNASKTKSGRKPYATHENDFTFRDASVKDV